METAVSGVDGNSEYHVHHHHHHHHNLYHQQYCGGGEDDYGDTRYDQDPDFTASSCYDHANDSYTPVIGYQQQQLESYTGTATASEPGDYYDYGWDYETAASSEQQTPQTPSYYYQQQQQQQLERQRRRDGRPVIHFSLFNNTLKLFKWNLLGGKNIFHFQKFRYLLGLKIQNGL